MVIYRILPVRRFGDKNYNGNDDDDADADDRRRLSSTIHQPFEPGSRQYPQTPRRLFVSKPEKKLKHESAIRPCFRRRRASCWLHDSTPSSDWEQVAEDLRSKTRRGMRRKRRMRWKSRKHRQETSNKMHKPFASPFASKRGSTELGAR